MIVAAAAALGLLVIAAFQVALALGAPLGRAAWGGRHTGTLPARLRVASGVATAVWIIAAFIVLGRGGLIAVPLPEAVLTWGTWVLVGVLVLGALANFVSASPWERFGWGPFAGILAALCLVVALA